MIFLYTSNIYNNKSLLYNIKFTQYTKLNNIEFNINNKSLFNNINNIVENYAKPTIIDDSNIAILTDLDSIYE